MQKDPIKVNSERVRMSTSRCNKWLEKKVRELKEIVNDEFQDKRLVEQLCKFCYYSEGYLTLQAFTFSSCGFCEAELMSSNSDIDCMCINCAKEKNLCVHCAADMSGNEKRIIRNK